MGEFSCKRESYKLDLSERQKHVQCQSIYKPRILLKKGGTVYNRNYVELILGCVILNHILGWIQTVDLFHDKFYLRILSLMHSMLEAVNQIGGLGWHRRLEKYREAREKGISFYDIDWDDV